MRLTPLLLVLLGCIGIGVAHAWPVRSIGHALTPPTPPTIIANNGITYYVDPDLGLDTDDGLLKVSDGAGHGPWKNPPGTSVAESTNFFTCADPLLAGTVSQTTTINAGDKISFKGGTVFRGQFGQIVSGKISSGTGNKASGNSVYFVGNEWPTTDGATASISGADPVTYVPCPSQAACGNNPNWANLSLITYTAAGKLPVFYSCDDAKCLHTTALYYVQNPKVISAPTAPVGIAVPPAPFWWDDHSSYLVSTIFTTTQMNCTGANATAPACITITTSLNNSFGGTGFGGAHILYYVSGNNVAQQSITSYSGNILTYTTSGMVTPAQFALVNSPVDVSEPLEFATLGVKGPCTTSCQAIAYLPAGSHGVVVSTGRTGTACSAAIQSRSGFMAGAWGGSLGLGYLYIGGFDFHDYASAGGETRNGAAIIAGTSQAANNIEIANDTFTNLLNYSRVPTIQLTGTNLSIHDSYANFNFGSIIQFTNVTGFEVNNNQFFWAGKTGVDVYGANYNTSTRASIHDNTICGGNGVHGNGISLYFTGSDASNNAYFDHNIDIFNNTVCNQMQAFTAHAHTNGTNVDLLANNWTLNGNLFDSSASGSQNPPFTFYAFGDQYTNVAMDGNVGAGPWSQLMKYDALHSTNVTVANSYGLGPLAGYCTYVTPPDTVYTQVYTQIQCGNTAATPSGATTNPGMTIDASMTYWNATIAPRMWDAPGSNNVINPVGNTTGEDICTTIQGTQTRPFRVGSNFVCVDNTGGSADHIFTSLHTYYLSPTGNDSNSGTDTSHAWLSPNHAVQCGDVLIAAAGAYTTNFQGAKWGTVSTCPSTTGGIDGAGGVNFAVVLCGGADLSACTVSNTDRAVDVTANNWAVEGFNITSPGSGSDGSGVAMYADGCNTSNSLHHFSFINNLIHDSGYGILGGNCGGTNVVDYEAFLGNIIQNSNGYLGPAYSCGGALDINAPKNYDTVAGTHIFIAGNFLNNNDGGTSTQCTSDQSAILLDTLERLSYNQQIVVSDNIIFNTANQGIQVFNQHTTTSAPTIKIYNNTTFASGQRVPDISAFNTAELNFAIGAGTTGVSTWVISSTNNIASTAGICAVGTNSPMYAGNFSSLANDQTPVPTFATNITWGTSTTSEGTSYPNSGQPIVTSCCSSDIGSHPLYVPGTNTYTDPLFTSTADLFANWSGTPACSVDNTTACMGYNLSTSTLTSLTPISDLQSSATGHTGKGYRVPTTCSANSDYPTWLKGIVYLHYTGSSIIEKSGLITKPCGL